MGRVMLDYGRRFPADHHGIKFFRESLQKAIENRWGGENTDTDRFDHQVDARTRLGKTNRPWQRCNKIDPCVAKAEEDRLQAEADRLLRKANEENRKRMQAQMQAMARKAQKGKKTVNTPKRRWGELKEVELAARDYKNSHGRLPTNDELKEHVAKAYDFRIRWPHLKKAIDAAAKDSTRRRLFASEKAGRAL